MLIGSRLVIALDSFQVVGMKGAVQLSPLLTVGTLGFEGAGITGGHISTVLHLLGLILGAKATQRLTSGTDVAILRHVIGELGGPIQGCFVLPVRQGNI